jgi:hypothetical protein
MAYFQSLQNAAKTARESSPNSAKMHFRVHVFQSKPTWQNLLNALAKDAIRIPKQAGPCRKKQCTAPRRTRFAVFLTPSK